MLHTKRRIKKQDTENTVSCFFTCTNNDSNINLSCLSYV